jgi:hypothetical protein
VALALLNSPDPDLRREEEEEAEPTLRYREQPINTGKLETHQKVRSCKPPIPDPTSLPSLLFVLLLLFFLFFTFRFSSLAFPNHHKPGPPRH